MGLQKIPDNKHIECHERTKWEGKVEYLGHIMRNENKCQLLLNIIQGRVKKKREDLVEKQFRIANSRIGMMLPRCKDMLLVKFA